MGRLSSSLYAVWRIANWRAEDLLIGFMPRAEKIIDVWPWATTLDHNASTYDGWAW